MRFESFHKIFKNIIKYIYCRKDILESCAFKVKMRYANLFLTFQTLQKSNLFTGKKTKIPSADLLKMFRCEIPLNEFVFHTKHLEIGSVVYKVGNVIQNQTEKDGTPIFVLIKDIFLMDNKILLGCQSLTNLGFDNHFYSYKVELEDFFFIKSVKSPQFKSSYIFYGTENRNFVKWD